MEWIKTDIYGDPDKAGLYVVSYHSANQTPEVKFWYGDCWQNSSIFEVAAWLGPLPEIPESTTQEAQKDD